ncbi:hypothetical protein ACS0TY_032463 [Phlomoides rotata]
MMMRGIGERWIKNYSSGHSILLVGEGDFSFSLSLAMAFGSATNIIATTLDSYDALISKYKDARENVDMLITLGASLWYGVDATQMKNHPDLWWKKFDRIVYNFPHAGFHGKEDDPSLITMHRNLVRGFLQNASSMLQLDGEIHINHKIKPPFDSWKLEDLALECSLICIAKDDFNCRDYKWYSHKRGSGWKPDESFPLGASKTFKFKLNPAAQENLRKQAMMPSSPQMFAMPPLGPSDVYDVNSSPNGLPLHNYTSECQILFGGYLNHVEETFGSDAYDVQRTAEEAMRLAFEMYMSAVPGRPSSDFIGILEELHNMSVLRSQQLQLMLLFQGQQL